MLRLILVKLSRVFSLQLTMKSAGIASLVCLISGCVTQTGVIPPSPGIIETSSSGNYLKARLAYHNHDLKNAVISYRAALESAPTNPLLLRMLFIAELEAGNHRQATEIAKQALKEKNKTLFMSLVIGLDHAKNKRWTKAFKQFDQMAPSPLNNILGPLLKGWSLIGLKDYHRARKNFLKLQKSKGFELLGFLHTALAFQYQDSPKAIDTLFVKALKQEQDPPARLILAAANHYYRTNRSDKAIKLIKQIKSNEYNHKYLINLMFRSNGRQIKEISSNSPGEGLGEALFDIANALQYDFNNNASLIFVRLALFMRPQYPPAQILLGELFHNHSKYSKAISQFENVPEKSIFYPMAQYRLSSSLKQSSKPTVAIALLENLHRRRPEEPESLISIGDIHRSLKNWKDAIAAYSKALSLTPNIQKHDWIIFYSRGVAFEQSGQWELAEVDFLKALDLAPEQPFVMNYLGYAWTEQSTNLAEAERLIRKAAKLRPKDGYITDSLGWILYSTSRFGKAVSVLERAVQLRPNDATINDHLGDAYWKVDRQTEAHYQWKRAMTMGPDSELMKKIREKLKHGLKQ